MSSSTSSAVPGEPLRTSRHRKKHSDPFSLLPDTISGCDIESKASKEEGDSSLYEKLILAPVTMLSFLLSLCVVTQQERVWRTSQQNNNSTSWVLKWFGAEPYQRPHDSTWHATPAVTSDLYNQGGSVPVPAVHMETWFTRKKHRKMAKKRIGDAFTMQNTMVIVLVSSALVLLLVTTWAVQKTIQWFGSSNLTEQNPPSSASI